MSEQTPGERYFYLGTQAALVVVTAVGIGIALRTLSDLNQSVKASNAQASAAATQAAIADEAMRIGNRPYVGVGRQQGPIAEWVFDKGKKSAVKIWFHNAGTTPAKRFYVNAQLMPSQPGTFTHLSMTAEPIKMLPNGCAPQKHIAQA